jgi:hypothetical protein
MAVEVGVLEGCSVAVAVGVLLGVSDGSLVVVTSGDAVASAVAVIVVSTVAVISVVAVGVGSSSSSGPKMAGKKAKKPPSSARALSGRCHTAAASSVTISPTPNKPNQTCRLSRSIMPPIYPAAQAPAGRCCRMLGSRAPRVPASARSEMDAAGKDAIRKRCKSPGAKIIPLYYSRRAPPLRVKEACVLGGC